jgi:hypothetical protein
MHDSQLEDRLRTSLRAEGDGLSMTITTAELERRLAVRQRQSRGRMLTAIAAVMAFVAVAAIAAMSNGWLRLPAVGATASPTPTETPHVSASPSATTPAIGETAPPPSCTTIDPSTVTSPIDIVFETSSGDQTVYVGAARVYRIGDTISGTAGRFADARPVNEAVTVASPASVLRVSAASYDACIVSVEADAVPIDQLDADPNPLSPGFAIPATPVATLSPPTTGSWVVRVQVGFATTSGDVWSEAFFNVDVGGPTATPETALGPPPSLPADLARTAWLQAKGDLYRFGQFGYRGWGTTDPTIRSASVDGDHVAYIVEDGVSRLSVYPVKDQSSDAIGPSAMVDAQPGDKLGRVWLDDRHGQLFYSVGSEDLASGLALHRLGITDGDQADTVVATVAEPFDVNAPPLGGWNAALSADRSAFVVETCAQPGRCELQIVDTTTLKVTTKTVTTDKSVCDIIGIVDGQVFTTTADVCKADFAGAPGAIQVVPLTGGAARTIFDGFGFDAIAIPTANGPRLVYSLDVAGSGKSLWVADPATGLGTVPYDLFKPSGSTHAVADRASNLPPGWLLIRRVDQDGNGVAVPQLISIDTGETYDLPNVPR